jgi:4-amino-4-deoxychorismate lyase
MRLRALVDGREADAIDIADRGLAYGDGLFETLLVAQGRPVWWEAHFARLQLGCERLRMPCPAQELLLRECTALADGVERGVVKLIVTRGAAGRGYAAPIEVRPSRILSLHPAPDAEPAASRNGIALHECELRLSRQPRLAGFKHLNRLEQVLARSEWESPAFGEGLLRDDEHRIVSATAANLFLVRRGALVTPDLSRCGIEGTCRAWILARRDVQVIDVDAGMLAASDELFLASSLRGILPVARIGGREWSVGPMTRSLQQELWREVPALAPAGTAW